VDLLLQRSGVPALFVNQDGFIVVLFEG